MIIYDLSHNTKHTKAFTIRQILLRDEFLIIHLLISIYTILQPLHGATFNRQMIIIRDYLYSLQISTNVSLQISVYRSQYKFHQTYALKSGQWTWFNINLKAADRINSDQQGLPIMRVLLLQQGLSSLPTSAKNMALGLLPNVLLLILHQDLV